MSYSLFSKTRKTRIVLLIANLDIATVLYQLLQKKTLLIVSREERDIKNSAEDWNNGEVNLRKVVH